MPIFILLTALLAFSQAFGSETYSGKGMMNDIAYSDYKNFSTEWKLVTIRYRKDTGEMRLTYANDQAIEVLKSGSINYPDGAVFAKTGIHTGVDDQFPSSVVPMGITRYQLMVRNKKKYASSGGWGYGLYDSNGKTFDEDPVETQASCYACHALVENRGDVFSQLFSFVDKTKFPSSNINKNYKAIKFKWTQRSTLPEAITKLMPNIKRVRFITNENLRKNVFQGTLDELKPVLINESKAKKQPSLFLSHDNKRFTLVRQNKQEHCDDNDSFEITSTSMKYEVISESYCATE